MEGLSAGERARVDRGNGQRDRGRRRGERHERVTVPCSEYGGRAVSLRRRAPRPPSHVRDGHEASGRFNVNFSHGSRGQDQGNR